VTTSAPLRREGDIPLVVPFVPPPEPKRLPAPNPERWIPFMPAIPVREPVRRAVRG